MITNISTVIHAPLFNILFLVAVAWSVAIFLERFRIPLIIGELIAGIIIGPTVLNIVRPSPEINILAQLGMFFLMFYAGLETNPRLIQKIAAKSILIGGLGTIFPFCFGILASLLFGCTWPQALLIGAAISGTSMVTKSRILSDLKLMKTLLGYHMMAAAIVDNLFSFLIVSLIIKGFQRGSFEISDLVFTALEVTLFFAIILTVGYLLFPRISHYFKTRRGKGFTFALLVGFSFAFLAELINLPFILGAYLAGLFVREEIMSASLFSKMNDRFLAITHGFLGPIFIISIAFKMNFQVLLTHSWLLFWLILAAFFGKFCGIYLGAMANRFNRVGSLIMAVGMNGRGTVELVLAVIGLQMGIINQAQFSILVLVAFLTTLSVPLLLNIIIKKNPVTTQKILQPFP
ncbi:MAG: cation:proton antiporter [bacterium]